MSECALHVCIYLLTRCFDTMTVNISCCMTLLTHVDVMLMFVGVVSIDCPRPVSLVVCLSVISRRAGWLYSCDRGECERETESGNSF